MNKKILFFVVLVFLSIFSFDLVDAATRTVGNSEIKNALLNYSNTEVLGPEVAGSNGLSVLTKIFIWVKNSLTSLVLVLSVGVFLFVGIRLGLARGNPEEFKKAWMQFIYAIIGIILISIAWGLVSLVAGLNI